MKKSVWLWEIFGFAVTVLCGTILHFLYDWLGGALWIAPFSSVNESTWEHMKLLFWPMFIYAAFESLFFKGYRNFRCVKLYSILIGIFSIPLIYYGYNGVIGKSPDFINISIFFISAAIAFIYSALALKKCDASCRSKGLDFVLLCSISLLFVIFTFKTPTLNIFRDPITGRYGI